MTRKTKIYYNLDSPARVSSERCHTVEKPASLCGDCMTPIELLSDPFPIKRTYIVQTSATSPIPIYQRVADTLCRQQKITTLAKIYKTDVQTILGLHIHSATLL